MTGFIQFSSIPAILHQVKCSVVFVCHSWLISLFLKIFTTEEIRILKSVISGSLMYKTPLYFALFLHYSFEIVSGTMSMHGLSKFLLDVLADHIVNNMV